MTVVWNNKLVDQIRLAGEDGIVDAVEEIYEETLRLVLDTSKSGKVYKNYRTGGVHQASAPNESFANMTGNALKNTNKKAVKMEGEVVAAYEYALALELGTPKMAPRPTLGRALQNTIPNLTKIVSKPIQKVLKK